MHGGMHMPQRRVEGLNDAEGVLFIHPPVLRYGAKHYH